MSHSESENDKAPAPHGEEISHVEPDEIGVGMMTVLFALCGVSLLLIVVLVQAWFYNWKNTVAAERPAAPVAEASPRAIADEQLKKIESYGWVDAKKQIRAIPITRAMELVVQEYGAAGGAENGSEKK